MLSVRAIYDGKNFKLLEKVKVNSPKEVIITFLDTQNSDLTSEELHLLADRGRAFDFLNNDEEDIYSDADLKICYKKR